MIFIWRGNGILVPIIGVAVMFFAYMGVAAVGGEHLSDHWKVAIAAWIGSLAALLFALLACRTREEIRIDPRSQQPVRYRIVHSLWGIPAIAWGFIGILLAAGFTSVAVNPSAGGGLGGSPAGHSAFDNANRRIASFDAQGDAFGNTGPATKLAEQFSQYVKEGRDLGIEQPKSDHFSFTDGHFLTYCQLEKDHCAFLVHVPDIRHFTEDAKQWLAKACWITARHLSAELNPAPKQLAVGIRGDILYDRVLMGEGGQGDPQAGLSQTLTGDHSKTALASFFVSSTPLSQPSPVRKTGTAPEIFKFANDYLTSGKTTPESGNMVEAVQISRKYASVVRRIFESTYVFQVKGGQKEIKLPVFSYCHVTKETCVFLSYVHDLHTMHGEPRDTFIRTAWQMACLGSQCFQPRPARVAIGLRDQDSYEVVQIGHAPASESDKPEAGIEQTLRGSEGEKALLPFFEPYQGPPFRMVGSLDVRHADGSPVAPESKAK